MLTRRLITNIKATTQILTSYIKQQVLNLTGLNYGGTNTFIDSSGNNFTITKAGTPYQGTVSPFGDNWSLYFDGAGAQLSATVPNVSGGIADFTVECYVHATSLIGSQYGRGIFTLFPTAGYTSMFIVRYNAAGSTFNVYHYNPSVGAVFGTSGIDFGTPIANTWVHLALVRYNGVFRIYLDGVVAWEDTAHTTLVLPDINSLLIGAYQDGTNPYFCGYLSGVRVSSKAQYTENFTPSTTPLTVIDGVQLLACNSAYLKDLSANNFTVTASGTPMVSKFSPFEVQEAIGGSIYLNGTTDYLVLSNDLQFDVNDFTVECWFNSNDITVTQKVIWLNGNTNASSYSGLQIDIAGRRLGCYVSTTGSSWSIARVNDIGPTLSSGVWYHLALVRSGTTFIVYLNGEQVYTTTLSSSLYAGPLNYIGALNYSGGYYTFNGLISTPRVVIGTAVYSSNFIPSTVPLTAIPSTQLLLSGTNSAIPDMVGISNVKLVGSPAIVDNAINFNGTSAYLDILSKPELQLGAGDFTAECWFKTNTITPAYQQLLWLNGITSGASYTALALSIQANKLDLLTSTSGSAWYTNSGGVGPVLAIGSWYHVAVVRNGSTMTLYLDGVAIYTVGVSGGLYAGTMNRIGAQYYIGGNNYFNGAMKNIKIIKEARYLSNFTPEN